MSDESKPLDLSELTGSNLGPAWVSEIGKPDPKHKDYTEFEERPGRGRDRKGRGGRDGRRDDRRGRDPRRDDRRGPRGGGGGGRREDRGGRDRRDGPKGGGGRRGDGHDRRGRGGRDRDGGWQQQREERPPEGIGVDLRPVPEGLQSLAKWIRSAGRATAVFEIAKALLRRRELYQLHFKRTSEKAPKLVRCEADGTLWTTREAALGHWIAAGVPGDFYVTEEVQVEPPKGNFTAIAVCGISGILLGPPNYHTYQSNLHRLHRERFSHMPIERYKSRINVEHGEEIVEKWKSQQSVSKRFRWLKDPNAKTDADPPSDSGEPEAGAEQPEDGIKDDAEVAEDTSGVPPAEEAGGDSGDPTAEGKEEVAGEVEAPAPSEDSDTPHEQAEESQPTGEETSDENAGGESAEPAATDETEAKPESGGAILETVDDLRRHALTHHADELFVELESAVVPGNVSGKQIGAPLLASLKAALEPLRRSPAPLVPGLCQDLENCGLKIFRWGKSLYANGCRPRPIDDANLSEGISKIVSLVKDHPGIGSKKILKVLTGVGDKSEAEPPKDESNKEAAEKSTPEEPVTEAAEAKEVEESGAESEAAAQIDSEATGKEKEQASAEPEPAEASAENPEVKPETPEPEGKKSPGAEESGGEIREDDPAVVAILRDLRWLVHEGYLIEFTDGKIFLASARPALKTAKKKQQPKRKRGPRPPKKHGTQGPTPVSQDAPTQKILRNVPPTEAAEVVSPSPEKAVESEDQNQEAVKIEPRESELVSPPDEKQGTPALSEQTDPANVAEKAPDQAKTSPAEPSIESAESSTGGNEEDGAKTKEE